MSGRRATGALDSGTNRAVSAMAARPIGMLIQNTPRQPTVSTSTPPRTGPSASDRPHAPPQAPIAFRTFGPVSERVGNDRHRHWVEHGPADRLHHAERDQPAQSRGQAAQPGAAVNTARPIWKTRRQANPVGGRAGQHEQAGQDQDVAVDGPLQAETSACRSADDRRRDVDERTVQADDEQARAAYDQHEHAAPAAEFWQRYHPE